MPSRTTITGAHLELLRRFGQNRVQRKLTSKKKEELWKLTCQTGGVPYVPYEEVVDEWRRMVTGDSNQTGLAIGATVDPKFATIAVCYREKSIGAHTVKIKALLARLLLLWSSCFETTDEFVSAVHDLTMKVADKKGKKK
tara:strand:- start:62 stop:481 length:420 start_codon:yes stop_codon:yes gene_type:complete